MTSPSHPHTQARVQPIHIYKHTYRKVLPGQNNFILTPDKTTCTLFTPDPAEYMSNLGLKIHNNVLPNGNTPKGFRSYLRPKTHIQHTHPQHLSTHTQTSTNHKSTHCNMMGYTEGDTHGYLQGSYETSSGVCLFHMVASFILDQH